jgi:hypothetical protein
VRAKLSGVRSLRVWLLLLLVCLLPVRGSLAATFVCDEIDGHGESHAAHVHAHLSASPHQHRHLALSPVLDHHAHAGSADKCNLYSGLTTPACMLESAPAVPLSLTRSKLVPQPTLWPASHVADRLKRPPRSI